jgi:predicted Rossmann fold flavoprotein
MKFDVIIVGAGAAGLMCAIEAGKRGRTCLVIEHNSRIGRKIEISGGGRCNFTNINTSPENFISANPNFCKSALARYTPSDFISLVKKHGIKFYEKKLGQLFCKESSRQIINMLLEEASGAKVKIRLDCHAHNVKKSILFQLETNQGGFECESLVIASGGLSIPTIGATDFGYRIAKQFGLKIIETRPALVPLVFNNEFESFKSLSGVSFNSIVRSGKRDFRENILLTHRGLSGPAILQISSYWKPHEDISINLFPEKNAHEFLKEIRNSRARVSSLLSQHLPARFAQAWSETYAPQKPLYQWSNKEIEKTATLLNDWRVRFDETEGYRKAEVTLGGIDTNELSSKTMESNRIKGLYFIGEVVDVTGWLGGYNFQWAWASGFAAGQSV